MKLLPTMDHNSPPPSLVHTFPVPVLHTVVTPYWPQANSEVERFNRTVEKAIRAANVEGKNWKEELDVFVLNYRSTPHCTTGQPPAVLLFGLIVLAMNLTDKNFCYSYYSLLQVSSIVRGLMDPFLCT